ncbi:MAG: chemotaxis protein CheW [Candidatus Riflebacteria bacterium]|nr:chemotaxis protein CheW [Candidatus Riflebacteria bacterium]
MDIDLNQFMGAYIDGSRENLDNMDKMLLALEQNPQNREAVEEIFRAAHTLKGMSATMGYEKIAHLTHEMENILDLLRTGKKEVDSFIIDILFETFDILRNIVNDSISGNDSNMDISQIIQKLSNLASGNNPSLNPAAKAPQSTQSQRTPQESPSAPNSNNLPQGVGDFQFTEYEIGGLLEAHHRGLSTTLLEVKLVQDCLLKGPRVFMIIRALEGLRCEIIKAIPDLKDLENEKFDRSFKMILICEQQTSEISEAIMEICEIESVHIDIFSPEKVKEGSKDSFASPEPPPPAAILPKPPVPSTPTQRPPSTFQGAPKPPSSQPSFNDSPSGIQPLRPPQSIPVQQQPAFQTPQPSRPALQENVPQELDLSKFQPKLVQKYEGLFSEVDEFRDREEHKEIVEISHLVSFKMAGETYAFEISKVEGIINLLPITRVPKSPSYIEGVINMRGEIVPVINLRHRLRLEKKQRETTDQIIILNFEKEKVKVGFLVDAVYEVIRLPVNAIEEPSRVSDDVEIEYLTGVGKIHGKIIILLNAQKIVFG